MLKKIFLLLTLAIVFTACYKDEEVLQLLMEIRSQNTALRAQVENLQRTTDSLAQALKNTNTSIANLDKKVDSIRLQLRLVLVEMDSLNSQLLQANSNIIDIQLKLAELQRKCEELYRLLNSYIASMNSINISNGLVAFYPFTGNMMDSSGNNYHGQVPSGQSPILTTDRFGISGRAYYFSSESSIVAPNTTGLNLLPLSISLWYNVDTLYKGMIANVFSKYVAATWNGYQILLGDFSAVSNSGTSENDGYGVTPWYIKDYNNRIIGYYGEPSFLQKNISTKRWYHYVFTVDSANAQIYVDGNLVATDKWTGNPGPSSNGYAFKIGGKYDGQGYRGKIDDIRVYNRVLSKSDIEYLYKN